MAHTTSSYYKDRLGFEPDYSTSSRGGSSVVKDSVSKAGHFVGTHVGNGRIEDSMKGGVYEENLNKFKGRN